MHLSQVEIVSTDKLNIGDRVATNGAVFELTEVRTRPCEYAANGLVYAFKTNLIALTKYNAIPSHWLHDWTIQGNDIAIWSRVRADH